MAFGVNKVMLIGNVGSQPEIKALSNGNTIAKISLATSESYTDSNSKEKVTKTEWHNINVYGKLAKIVGDYVQKGHKLYVSGKLNTFKYVDKNNIERKTTVIVALELQMLNSKTSDIKYTQDENQDENIGNVSNNEIDFIDIPF